MVEYAKNVAWFSGAWNFILEDFGSPFFYCFNNFVYLELHPLFHRVGSLRHLCILVWCEYENAL
jgi:hypothetical protein